MQSTPRQQPPQLAIATFSYRAESVPDWIGFPVFRAWLAPTIMTIRTARGRRQSYEYGDRRRPLARHLFYGSSATSNQRLIIQRGNCATSLYDRTTRHALSRPLGRTTHAALFADDQDLRVGGSVGRGAR